MKIFRGLILIVILFTGRLYAQQRGTPIVLDSSKKVLDSKKVYSHARRATVMSALLPGLGQAYNKKYWKIPIIYAGLGSFAYFYIVNNREYTYYRDNLKAIYDDDSTTFNTTNYQDWQLQSLKDQYKKNRDLSLIGFFAVYLLNIIDANVDGHLSTFDVSDNLGLHIEPWIHPKNNNRGTGSGVYGLQFTLMLK